MNWHLFRFSLIAAILVSTLGTNIARSAEEMPESKQAEPPQTTEEAQSRLEQVLKHRTETESREWRFPLDAERTYSPADGKPTLHVTVKGSITTGAPYRLGNSIAFDDLFVIERTEYDVDASGQRTLRNTSTRHQARRYVLRLVQGQWFYDAVVVSSSKTDELGAPGPVGSVTWLDGGIRLTGADNASSYLDSDGSPKLGVAISKVQFLRDGQQLWRSYESQPYELLTTKDGQQLQAPDQSKPFGKSFSSVMKSQSP